jgi:glycosyltransferase involved in cell wall biosynthesis
MKLLISTFTYFPNKDGVAIASETLAEGLAAKGWNVTVATCAEGMPNRSVRNGVNIVRFDFQRGGFTFDPNCEAADKYRAFVVAGGFDVLVSQCWEVWSTVCLLPIIPALKAKRVLVSHGFRLHVYHWYPRFAFGIPSWLRKLRLLAKVVPMTLRHYDAIVVLSTKKDFRNFFDHRFIHAAGFEKIAIIPNAIVPDSFSGDGEAFKTQYAAGGGLMVLSVANYCERKDQMLGLRVFRKANVPDSVMVFIGSNFNEYAESLKRLDDQLKNRYPNGSVLFLEKLSREETFSAFKACDVFLLTAQAETQPIVIIEAMAAGKPWLSTDTGCVRTMDGGMVGTGEAQLTRLLRDLLADEAKRAALGASGMRTVREQHGQALYIERYEELLNLLVEDRKSSEGDLRANPPIMTSP